MAASTRSPLAVMISPRFRTASPASKREWPRCTTAACHLVHGNVLQAFVTQPFGMLAAAAGVLLGAHALWCLARRRSFVDLLVRLPFWWIAAAAFALLLLAWGYKCLVWQP